MDEDADRGAEVREGIGLRLKEAHYPGRAPVDAYGNGGFRFADMSHRGSILCLPSGIYGWSPTATDGLRAEDFDRLIDETDLEFLMIGTGEELTAIPAEVQAALQNAKLRFEPMSTGAAVRTLNVMLAEDRLVGAALIAVD